MLVGSCLSLIGVGAIIVDVVRYKRLRTLVGRPIAPLLYRSACDGVFASMFLVAHIFLAEDSDPLTQRTIFDEGTCIRLAFMTQVVLLAGECWYLVVSIDVIVDLVASPFNDATTRVVIYHTFIWCFSISMGVVLLKDDEAGQSTVFNWCWRRNFAAEDQDNDQLAGFLYLYGEVVLIYSFSLVVWFLARVSLNKGIPRTYRVREQRIMQGKGIVLGFSVYWSVFGALYSIVLFADNSGSKTTGLWIWVWLGFSLLLCSRGLVDFFIWKLYHLRNITIVID